MRISLIGTVHAENGLANVRTLGSILDRLQPEVIFAEIPRASFPLYVDGSHGNLESMAVSQYREKHSATVVPVDLDKPNDDFFRKSEEMFNKVEKTSSVYRRMLDQHSDDTRNYGFPYLNSDRCGHAWSDIYKEAIETVEWIGDLRLRQVYMQWKETIDLRETAMLENINKYSNGSALSHGVLLVGAAHRKALVDKAQQFPSPKATEILWNFETSVV